MAIIYADSDRAILRVDTLSVPIAPPAGAVRRAELDEATNADLIAELVTNPRNFRVTDAGTIERANGQPVTVAPDSRRRRDLLSIEDIRAKLHRDETLTAPEIRVWMRWQESQQGDG